MNNKRAFQLNDELKRWKEILKREYNPYKIILFGSFPKGKIGDWSDIDMVIIKDSNKPFLDRIKEVLLLLKPEVGLDVLVYTQEEFKKLLSTRLFFKEEISRKGAVIYERGD
ncbi:MAG: nucleotidyltransferase domain-containing protein [bacterium]